MLLLELFCGTKSISKEFKGWDVITVDFDPQFNPDICDDIRNLKAEQFQGVDMIWASPPCTTFSVSSIGKHWNKDHTPKTDEAIEGLEILHKTISLINSINPRFFFIENPRGKMRKMEILENLTRDTVTYCQYGDFRMKPTDIWHNTDIKLLPPCKNGMTCHTPAPRGSKTGTQGMGTAVEKGVIPPKLAQSIYEYVNNAYITL